MRRVLPLPLVIVALALASTTLNAATLAATKTSTVRKQLPQRNLAVGASAAQRAQIAESLAKDASAPLKRVTLRELIGTTMSETEKNLNRTLADAERSGSVLFFDEADALFGKRTAVKDSHDRYANIDTAALLQKIEASRAIVVLGVGAEPNDPASIQRWQRVQTVKLPPKP